MSKIPPSHKLTLQFNVYTSYIAYITFTAFTPNEAYTAYAAFHMPTIAIGDLSNN